MCDVMLTIFYQHANCHANATYPFWKLYLGKENNFDKSKTKQECIPVGCVPSATVAVSGGSATWGVRGGLLQGERRGVCSQGVCSEGGGSALGGCLLPEGSAPGGCLLLGGCLLWGVCLVPRGVCLVPGGCGSGGIPACTEADPPVDRQTPVKT